MIRMQLLVAAIFASMHLSTGQFDLSTGFRNPPASAKPHNWWHWMNGNITRQGITADLEAIKQAGIGGAHILDAGQGIPAGPIKCNSPEWRALMSHAFHEAERLGLDMTMHNCSGWSSSGGPWVTSDDAMKKVTSIAMEFSGTGNPIFPEPKTVGNYYKDIAIIAFPVTSAQSTASFHELTSLGPNPGKVTTLNWPRMDKAKAINIPLDRLRSDGTLDYIFDGGKWTILRIGVTLTGAQNVASRPSGEELEVKKLSRASLDRFFAGGLDPLFQEVGSDSALHTVLIDSYETGYNNWTPDIMEEFMSRRGYDANPFLPAFTGFVVGDTAQTLGFLFDYRKTLAELWAQNYSGYFAQKLADKGLGLAVEPYGNGNFDPFTYGKPATLIMGEYWVGETPINPSVKVASSVAHVYDHAVVGAEALTARPNQEGWRNQPRQWKPFADIGMTKGINRIIYHRLAHQPWVSGVNPGMTMGPWGSHVDRTNTIWPYMSTWNTYLSRSQYMLQSGKSANDILLFAGKDAPQSYSGEGQELPQIPDGYDFDFCGLDPLMSLSVKNRRLTLWNGVSFAVLVLPNTDQMTIPVAAKIKSLIEAGATVMGPKPTFTPSFEESSNGGNRTIQTIAKSIWGESASASGSRNVGLGKVIWGRTVKNALQEVKLAPDFTSSTKDVQAIHRRYGSTDAYFVASARQFPSSVNCHFRVDSSKVSVQLWHPETGCIEDAPVWHATSTGIDLPLDFDCTGSVFVVFQPKPSSAKHITSITTNVATQAAKPAPTLRILKATYGDVASGKFFDVTKILTKAVDKSAISINAFNSEMGGSPAVNIIKTLVVTYEFGGETKTVVIPENGTLAIGDLPPESTPPTYQYENNKLYAWQNGAYGQT